MKLESPITFVRAIKGAPASVLWAMMFNRQMMTSLELHEWTGYGGDNLKTALRLLADLGWVVARSARGPWGLAEGRQLPLMGGIAEFEDFENPDSDLIGVSGVLSSSFNTKALLSSNQEEQEEEGPDSDLIGVSASAESLVREKIGANMAACDECGIRNPKKKIISSLPHVTPEFIRGHVAQAKNDCCEIGTAIYRIQYDWSLSDAYLKLKEVVSYRDFLRREEEEDFEHDMDCRCLDCRREHPERFCSYKTEIQGARRFGHSMSGECGAIVAPGHSYCKIHVQFEREEE